MATFINSGFRVDSSKSFIERYDSNNSHYDSVNNTSGNLNHLFILFGKDTVWADELNPPAITDSINEISSRWTNAIAASNISSTNIAPVIPRVDYAFNSPNFAPFDNASSTPYNPTNSFYCMNAKFEVYQLLSGTGNTNATIAPDKLNTNAQGQVSIANAASNSNHVWQYLYTISSIDVGHFITNLWIPVNYFAKFDSTDTKAHPDAIDILGSSQVMLYTIISDGDFGVNDTTTTFTQYRELSIVSNPFNANTTTRSTVGNILVSGNLEPSSGDMLYTENRKVVFRNPGQSEEIRILFDF